MFNYMSENNYSVIVKLPGNFLFFYLVYAYLDEFTFSQFYLNDFQLFIAYHKKCINKFYYVYILHYMKFNVYLYFSIFT